MPTVGRTPTQTPVALRFRLRTAIAVLAVSAVVCGALFQGVPMIIRYGVSRHQRAITEELVYFDQQCTQITDRKGAADAIAMLDYVQNYYVPCPGYRGTDESEQTLETQRKRTMQAYATVLADFTGESHGFDVTAWQSWLVSSAPKKE